MKEEADWPSGKVGKQKDLVSPDSVSAVLSLQTLWFVDTANYPPTPTVTPSTHTSITINETFTNYQK